MFLKFVFSLWLVSLMAGTTDAVLLTVENFEQLTAGRSIFIKFFAPWCEIRWRSEWLVLCLWVRFVSV
jgi:hypothetical protein